MHKTELEGRNRGKPPRMRNYDSCSDCWGSIDKEIDGENKLWCKKYQFKTDKDGLCDGYVE